MIPGLVGAFSAAFFYGTATVLQAVGVRRMSALPAGCRMAHRLWAGRLFGVGLMVDAAGFVASLVALRTLPLFLVQSVIASSVGVTVVLAILFLGARLRTGEVAALVVIGVGLVALAVSAAPSEAVGLGAHQRWLLLAGVFPLALLAGVGAIGVGALATSPSGLLSRLRSSSRAGVVLLAVGAGLGFSGVGVAARVVVIPHPWWSGAADPVVWALVGYSVVAFLCYGLALSAGSVTVVAAVTFGVETVVPATIGVALLGDGVRTGLGALALFGFVATVAGCIALASHAEIDHVPVT